MGKSIKDEHLDDLFDAILRLENREQCSAFFSDLCTINELIAMKQRFWVARLLDEGMTYNDIVEKTGVSTATISRINRCLDYGDGYSSVLKKAEAGK